MTYHHRRVKKVLVTENVQMAPAFQQIRHGTIFLPGKVQPEEPMRWSQGEQFGDALFGLGLIFYSMELMSSAFSFVSTRNP